MLSRPFYFIYSDNFSLPHFFPSFLSFAMPRSRNSRARRARTVYFRVLANIVDVAIEVHADLSFSDPVPNEVYTTAPETETTTTSTTLAKFSVTEVPVDEFDGIYLDGNEFDYVSY